MNSFPFGRRTGTRCLLSRVFPPAPFFICSRFHGGGGKGTKAFSLHRNKRRQVNRMIVKMVPSRECTTTCGHVIFVPSSPLRLLTMFSIHMHQRSEKIHPCSTWCIICDSHGKIEEPFRLPEDVTFNLWTRWWLTWELLVKKATTPSN